MSVEEKNFSGDRSDEKLITYKRRRVHNENPSPQEVGSSYTKQKRKTKEKDIGWYHGQMVNGIKQHWRCKYCGMTRHGGGVTRLKLHLVGHRDVLKCPNVPDQVAEEISRHLFLKEKEKPLLNLNWNGKKRRKERRIRPARQVEQEEIVEVDKTDSNPTEYESDEPEEDLDTEMLQKDIEDKMQWCSLSCMVERHENTNYEVLKNTNKITHHSNKEYKADMLSGTNDETERHSQVRNDAKGSNSGNHYRSWRNVLESMLPLPDGNGIENSIGSIGVHGCIRRALSSPQAYVASQVGVKENVEKCQNALVSILNSDKFGLVCHLLHNNFRDEKSAVRNYFDFGEIDAKMKNGDYEKSPQLFSNDIMKFWKNLEHVGQEMVRLAANLSSISRANIENEVGIHVVDLEESIDPYQGRYCNHCRYEIINNWGLVSCKGCDISYHTSCINPVIHDSTNSWYCSACLSKQPDMPITIGVDDVDCQEESNAETVQPCITSMYRLCKICGIRADGEREFVVCSHPECPYKYYHTQCLKKIRPVISMQEDSTCWFCPSCLCRVCRDNKDDPLLVLCDGCDESYHIYCMDPPCDSVPIGKWYCGKCSKKRRRKRGKTKTDMQNLGSRRFKENGVVPSHLVNDSTKITKMEDKKQAHQSMDMLMTAIDTLSAQEKLPN